MKKSTIIAATAAALVTVGALSGCATSTDADVASFNLSKAAEQFEIDRRVVFINGITDEYLLEIKGRCSLENQGTELEVTCRTGEGQYTKHFLGLSDNVTYFAEQLGPAQVDVYRYEVIFRPTAILPDVQVVTPGVAMDPDDTADIDPEEEDAQ